MSPHPELFSITYFGWLFQGVAVAGIHQLERVAVTVLSSPTNRDVEESKAASFDIMALKLVVCLQLMRFQLLQRLTSSRFALLR